jgi:hypothetical protein
MSHTHMSQGRALQSDGPRERFIKGLDPGQLALLACLLWRRRRRRLV